MICSACSAEKDLGDRLPKFWKRIGGDVLCQACVRDRYALRAVTIPIAGPVCTEKPGHKASEPLDWTQFRELLKASWIATTQASNWAVRHLALADPGLGDDGKIQKMPRVYLYPEIRERWPSLATCSVNTLEQSIQGRYRASRLDVALNKVSLPSFRYPVPIPIHNATWSVWEDEGGRLLLSFLIGGQRVTVRLRGGSNFRRQLGMVRKIISGDAVQGELAIYRVSAGGGDHRNGDTKGTRVMAKMVARIPREVRTGESVAAMHTGGDSFLALYDANRNQIFRWNADHIRRRIAEHDEELQRLREDLKAERRMGRDRDGILARLELVSRKQRGRLHAFCHETAASVVGMLKRRRCGTLIFVNADTSYMPHFPWHKLNTLLEDKCRAAGIELASGAEVAKTP